MRRRGVIRRVTAALLGAIQLGGCAGLRLHEGPPGRPDRLRVTRTDGTTVELSQPVSRGDTLFGWTTIPARKGTFALDRSEILALEVRGLGARLTLRDSSVIDIEDLWERGDSLGGAGTLRSRREYVAIPLSDLAHVNERNPLYRPAAAPGELALFPGDIIRVRVGDTTAPKGRTAEYRGTFRQFANDTLVLLARKRGVLRVPLANTRRIEVFDGTHGHAATGLLVGLLVGGAGAAVVAATYKSPPPCGYVCDRGVAGLAPVYEGGIAVVGGVVLGTLVGAGIRTERWHKVSLPREQPR